MCSVNLVAIVLGSLHSVFLRSSTSFSFFIWVTSALWLLPAVCLHVIGVSFFCPSEPFVDSSSFVGDNFFGSVPSLVFLPISVTISSASLDTERRFSSSLDGCGDFFNAGWIRVIFFGSGIHLEGSSLLVSGISVCLLSSTRLSVYFFKQSTSALRLLWLRGDRDGLRWLVPNGPALSWVKKIPVITILALRISYPFKNYSPKQDVTLRNPICAKYHAGQMQCASWLRMLEDLSWMCVIPRLVYCTLLQCSR